jgi:hypothetical protein
MDGLSLSRRFATMGTNGHFQQHDDTEPGQRLAVGFGNIFGISRKNKATSSD